MACTAQALQAWLDNDGVRRSLGGSMEDRLDVVPVGIEREGRVIARVVIAFSGSAVVNTAVGDGCCMEGRDRMAVLGLKREVHPGNRAVRLVDPQLVAGKMACAFRREGSSDCAQNRAIERPARLQIGDPQVDVVDKPAEMMVRSHASTSCGPERPRASINCPRARCWPP